MVYPQTFQDIFPFKHIKCNVVFFHPLVSLISEYTQKKMSSLLQDKEINKEKAKTEKREKRNKEEGKRKEKKKRSRFGQEGDS